MYRAIIIDESARLSSNETDYGCAFKALELMISRVYEYI